MFQCTTKRKDLCWRHYLETRKTLWSGVLGPRYDRVRNGGGEIPGLATTTSVKSCSTTPAAIGGVRTNMKALFRRLGAPPVGYVHLLYLLQNSEEQPTGTCTNERGSPWLSLLAEQTVIVHLLVENFTRFSRWGTAQTGMLPCKTKTKTRDIYRSQNCPQNRSCSDRSQDFESEDTTG